MPIFSIKEYLYAGLATIAFIAVLWFIHHERQIGAAEVTEAVEAAVAKAQTKITADAATQNAAVETKFNQLTLGLKPYDPAAYLLPGCTGVADPDLVRRVNAAHKAH